MDQSILKNMHFTPRRLQNIITYVIQIGNINSSSLYTYSINLGLNTKAQQVLTYYRE